MKIRIRFVSNSSSASFILDKKYLNAEQIVAIKKHGELPECHNNNDAWQIIEKEETIECSTSIDNFDLERYIKRLRVNPSAYIRKDYF